MRQVDEKTEGRTGREKDRKTDGRRQSTETEKDKENEEKYT